MWVLKEPYEQKNGNGGGWKLDDKIKVFSKEHIDYFLKNEQLFIDAYHPAQWKIKKQIYVNEIIKTINELKINKLK